MKITIIGAGNMGGALAHGLATVPDTHVTVADPSDAHLQNVKLVAPSVTTCADNREALRDADIVILAVKPWVVAGVIEEIKPALDYSRQTVASIVGGLGLSPLSEMLKKEDGSLPPTYYIIPNTAISIGESMTFLTSVRSTPEMDRWLLDAFMRLGDAMLVEERLVNPGMAIASCGIAYAMRYVRAATEGGVQLGLRPEEAQRAAIQTLRGAAMLLQKTGEHPEAEIDRVTTAGGVTIRGLNAMEAAGFTPAVIAGLIASCPK